MLRALRRSTSSAGLSARIAAILRIAGRNPMSSMRSASSSTSVCRAPNWTSLRSRKSSNRPGVATTIRAPLRMALSCGPSDKPPTTRAAGASCLPRNTLYCSTTCMASSRVGTSTSAAIPAAFRAPSRSMIGIRNASVFPVPVWAVASTSLPSMACGIAAACTGVGTRKLAAASLSFIEEEMGNSEKFCILLSCWRKRSAGANFRAGAIGSWPVLF